MGIGSACTGRDAGADSEETIGAYSFIGREERGVNSAGLLIGAPVRGSPLKASDRPGASESVEAMV